MKDENPGISPNKILSKIGELWKEKKENDKETIEKYEKMAEEDRIRYKNELEKYNTADKVSSSTQPPPPLSPVEVEKIKYTPPSSPKSESERSEYRSEDYESTSEGEDEEDEEEYDSEKLDEIKAFHIFVEKKSRKLKKIYPDLSSKEINENLHRVWNKLSRDEKADIVDRYLYS